MKKLLTFLLVLIGLTAAAQKALPLAIEDPKMDNYLMQRKPAVLTIAVENIPADSVKRVPVKYVLVQLGVGFQTTRYAETNEKGIVHITLDQNFPYQQIWLSVGEYLYAGIYVNSALTVGIDVRKLPKSGGYMIGDGITYSGEDGELNTVMNWHVLYKKAEREALGNRLREVCVFRKKMSAPAFSEAIDSVKNQLDRLDSEFLVAYKDYAWAVRSETLTDLYGMLAYSYSFETMPADLLVKVNAHRPYFTSNDGAGFYRNLGNYTRALNRQRGLHSLSRSLELADSLYTREKADLVKLAYLETEKDVYAASYAAIISSLNMKWGKRLASHELEKATANQKRIDSLFARSAKIEESFIGTPLVKTPFNAELYKLDEIRSIDELMVNLKQKFPGKALILDFWATWCGPCLSDLPNSKKLHEANKDLPIVYIYLCTSSGSTLETWKNRLGDLQIPGTHVFVQDHIISQLKQLLNANGGYPAYVVIDANGQVNAKAITRMGDLNRESLKKVTGVK